MPSLRALLAVSILLVTDLAAAAIPATPVMTLYRFNGPMTTPYYDVDRFLHSGASKPAGSLTMGTSIIPCLVIRNGKPVTDSKGTPYVGFEIVVDASKAKASDSERFKREFDKRKAMRVANHHCKPGVRHVVNVRHFYQLSKPPFFDPAGKGNANKAGGKSQLDRLVRQFHNTPHCARAFSRLTGRRGALERAWESFIRDNKSRVDATTLAKAKHLDYTMRTALFEGHLERGCNAYGACERNIIALSVRNRAKGQCLKRQGCRFPGDFQGVASKPNQYNIWDEFLTQISGLTACYLRTDLPNKDDLYRRLQAMYTQNVGDVERILYGSESDLQRLFPKNSLKDIVGMRHYYHAPAMGKCFPKHKRVEYMSGAVAKNGGDYALIADTRIQADGRAGGGWRFKEFRFEQKDDFDDIDVQNNFPGFIVDGRKVGGFKVPSRCVPYGIPSGCRHGSVERYRRTPSWVNAGKPLGLTCNIKDRGEQCRGGGSSRSVEVGGRCDTQMRPVSHVR